MPLDDIRVLDVATFVAAPFGATCLAEFGADVIKVERPGIGDDLRRLGTPSEAGDTYWWLNDARNKRCITLNLKDERGAALFRRLAATADVVIENFRPGTMERWGLGFTDLLAVNPRLVMLRVSAYGQTGPKSSLPGFARIAQAYAGLSYVTGQPDTPPLIAGSTTLADYLSGLYGAFGVMLALRAREKTGRGQYIDIGLHDGIFRFLDEIAAVYDKTGHVRERSGTETHTATPHSHYPCADGRWVAIACTNDKMFTRLTQVMGRPELADDERYRLKRSRLERREEVNAIVRAWTSSHDRESVIRWCSDGEVPVRAGVQHRGHLQRGAVLGAGHPHPRDRSAGRRARPPGHDPEAVRHPRRDPPSRDHPRRPQRGRLRRGAGSHERGDGGAVRSTSDLT